MEPKVTFTTYYLNDDIDSAFIEFSKREPGVYGDFEIPDDIMTMVYYKKGVSVEYQYIEVVDPQVFVNSPELENFEVNGYNVRKLILDAYEQESKQSA